MGDHRMSQVNRKIRDKQAVEHHIEGVYCTKGNCRCSFDVRSFNSSSLSQTSQNDVLFLVAFVVFVSLLTYAEAVSELTDRVCKQLSWLDWQTVTNDVNYETLIHQSRMGHFASTQPQAAKTR